MCALCVRDVRAMCARCARYVCVMCTLCVRDVRAMCARVGSSTGVELKGSTRFALRIKAVEFAKEAKQEQGPAIDKEAVRA